MNMGKRMFIFKYYFSDTGITEQFLSTTFQQLLRGIFNVDTIRMLKSTAMQNKNNRIYHY